MVKSIKDLNLKGKKTFIRVDFNVPIKDGVVGDDTRIQEAAKTIRYAMEQGARVALCSHLGRPKGEKKMEFSLKPVADYINAKNIFPVIFVEDCVGKVVEDAVNIMKDGIVILLVIIRFYKWVDIIDQAF